MKNYRSKDEKYMRRCLQLAANGIHGARPNPMVGAVIVANDRIIGEGYHVRCGEGHAEVNAFASVNPEDETAEGCHHLCLAGTMCPLWQDAPLCRADSP